jgi:hypothetical protein
VAAVTGAAWPKHLRRAQRTAATHKSLNSRVGRADTRAVERIDIEGDARVVSRVRAMRSTGDLGDTERITVVGCQPQHTAQHASVEIYCATGSIAVAAAAGGSSSGGIVNVGLSRRSIDHARNMEIQQANRAVVLNPGRDLRAGQAAARHRRRRWRMGCGRRGCAGCGWRQQAIPALGSPSYVYLRDQLLVLEEWQGDDKVFRLYQVGMQGYLSYVPSLTN